MLRHRRIRSVFRHKKLVRNIPMSISRKNQRVAWETSNSSPKVGLRSTTTSVKAERDLLTSVLETLSQSRQINEYLERLVEQVRNYSGCRCVGIRLLDDDGNIPYTSYTGFSREFYESESPLSICCQSAIMGHSGTEHFGLVRRGGEAL